MAEKQQDYDIEITLQTLKYATRQLVAELDLQQLVFHSICTIADFSSSQNLSLLLINEDGSSATLLGTMVNGNYQETGQEFTIRNTPFAKVIETKNSSDYPCQRKYEYPIPTSTIFSKSRHCTCLPLIGTNNKIIGFINYEHRQDYRVSKNHEEIITVITTLIATAIENARLFQMATIDGLTGLYVRRYFDIRLQEEITRLKRVDSDLALIVFDIDHFKKINDTYGHQQGDIILRELAEIIKNAVRKDVDIPCRYGGEELVLILPGTDLEGGVVLGERIRKRCEDHQFKSLSDKEIRATISGGIAAINSKSLIDKDAFFQIADKKLYEAKQAGRNRIRF
ncbi:MAG: GGDEF domain-containing protein [Fidelibacterota bacterium]